MHIQTLYFCFYYLINYFIKYMVESFFFLLCCLFDFCNQNICSFCISLLNVEFKCREYEGRIESGFVKCKVDFNFITKTHFIKQLQMSKSTLSYSIQEAKLQLQMTLWVMRYLSYLYVYLIYLRDTWYLNNIFIKSVI